MGRQHTAGHSHTFADSLVTLDNLSMFLDRKPHDDWERVFAICTHMELYWTLEPGTHRYRGNSANHCITEQNHAGFMLVTIYESGSVPLIYRCLILLHFSVVSLSK